MCEAEIKAKVNSTELEKRLLDAGFIFVSSCTEEDLYLNSSIRDFGKTDEALRIRKQTGNGREKTYLTYKGPKLDSVSQSRNETEFGVSSAQKALEFFTHLGFIPVLTVKKDRRTYKREEVTAVLDNVENLGEFLELEMLTGSGADEAVPVLYSVLAELGVKENALTDKSYLELLQTR